MYHNGSMATGSHSLEIRGFSMTKGMRVGQYISSDPFLVGGHCWKIQFYPNGDGKKDADHIYGSAGGGDEGYVSLNIALVSKSEEEVKACIEYAFWDRNRNNRWNKGHRYFIISPDMTDVCENSFFYTRANLEASHFIIDDCLTIQCTIGVTKTSPETFSKPLPLSELGQSYKQLLESREGSDVSFEVEGELFYAHKLILSIRSPVFKAQFFGPLKEEDTRCIQIHEMQAPVFKALLDFIYCGVVPNVGEMIAGLDSKCVATMMIQHLLVAADRYGIESLRLICEVRLCKNIAINNVAASLALAERHGCIHLKRTCLDFIGLPKNIKAVMQTDGFKNLKESFPAVIIELLESIAWVRDYSCVSFLEGDAEGKRMRS
ncbi:hypothetical protein RD792_015075 [Penstemon davidsonii]|uniref:Uncharacterized protein n=1 Tax=Penstemon davidsonii TaxID=160366 RepID=A0ABR0CR66_9LAMI|nr:hypothetical protein RD792_015075 [Penstemon davidsonii]